MLIKPFLLFLLLLPYPHYLCPSSLPFKLARLHYQHNHETDHHEQKRNQGNQRNAAPAGRELAADDPVLALEIPMEPHEEDHDTDAHERRTNRLAEAAEMDGAGIRGIGRLDQRSVQSEELCDGYPDGGEGEGGA